MRIFVTGATGYIGSAVAAELLAAGHGVLGLARDAAADRKLASAGVEPHRGELTDLDALAAGARACDGVAHLAFIHDFSRYEENGRIDHRAVAAIADALEGSDKPFAITSGITVASPGRPGGAVTEDDPATYDSPSAVRAPSEEAALAAADRGVRSSIVRLPTSVHGPGDRAFVPAMVDIARNAGFAAYVGDGANRWPAVHRLDAARLFRLALEKAPPGARLHSVAEEGVAVRAIAETIGEGLGVPVRGIAPDEAAAHFDWLAMFAAIDSPGSSAKTRSLLGWEPREKGLLADMRDSGYFAAAEAPEPATAE